MSECMDEKHLVGKKVKLVFDDRDKVSVAYGIITGYSDNFIFLNSNESDQAISKNKIIRIEVIREDD